MLQNPFIYRTPVVGADFYNRENIIESILNATVANPAKGSIWLVGSRQVGKSSLLQHIEAHYRDYNGKAIFQESEQAFSIAFIYVNCQADRNAEEFYYSLTRSLIDRFSFRIKKQNLDNYSYFIEWLKKLHKESIYVVFLIDEFDALLQSFIQDNEKEAADFLDKL
jgi:Cdc6-like AAA superfamily ATPase